VDKKADFPEEEKRLFHVASVEKAEPNRNLCWTLEVGSKEADNKLKMNEKRSRRCV